MEVYYINHKNQKIDLGRAPFQIQIGDLFDFSNKYEGSNFKISRIYKDITTLQTTITIDAPNEKDFFDAVNTFFEITETDTAAGVQGILYIGEYYLRCNLISSNKSFWKEVFSGVENSVKLLVPYPYWCREVTKSFLKGNPVSSRTEEEFLLYPFGYPYQYSMPQDAGFLDNDHYAPCDFQLIIYGPCENPSIRVNGHLYEVMATLYSGDYMVVDSRDNTVFLQKSDGRKVNLFNWRNKDSDLFEKIPAGRSSVTWNTAAFGFDLTVFQERSEPKWIL